MQAPCLGVIDVGSNSIRLLVGRAQGGQVERLFGHRITTRMLQGVRDGLLTEKAIGENAAAIAELTRLARAHGAQRVLAFGTSALRDAGNREALSDRTQQLCGVRVTLLSGEEEASLAYSGCASEGRCGVIDIGGGSTELLVGADGKVLFAGSARMGAVRLMDRTCGAYDDPEALVQAAQAALEPALAGGLGLPVDRYIGEGGTITTLAAMTWRVSKYTPDAIEHCPLTRQGAQEWLIRLCCMDVEARRAIPGLPAHRADVIPFGTAILCAVMRLTGAQTVYATDRDNLDGYIRLHTSTV